MVFLGFAFLLVEEIIFNDNGANTDNSFTSLWKSSPEMVKDKVFYVFLDLFSVLFCFFISIVGAIFTGTVFAVSHGYLL